MKNKFFTKVRRLHSLVHMNVYTFGLDLSGELTDQHCHPLKIVAQLRCFKVQAKDPVQKSPKASPY